MDNNTFVWTDELVKEYQSFYVQNPFHTMEDFKGLKSKTIDYEIVEYGYAQNNENKPDQQYISTVKRLSDQEVFSIGDVTTDGKIEEFRTFGVNGCAAFFEGGTRKNWINLMQKEKQPLFTTETGDPVYYMDKYWVVAKDWSIEYFHAKMELSGKNPENKYFSTQEAANKYVLMNKPLLSLSEILSVWGNDYEKDKTIYTSTPLFQQIKNLAQSKIQ